MTFRAVLLALAIATLATPLAAQAIRGRVLLPDSLTPVVSARLEVSDSTGTTVGRAVTGLDGRFTIPLPRPGDYQLQAVRIGYAPSRIPVLGVGADEVRVLEIYIAEQPLRLDAIDVRGNDRCRMSRGERERFVALWVRARQALGPHVSATPHEVVAQTLAIPGTQDGPARNFGNELVWSADLNYPAVDSIGAHEQHSSVFLATTSADTLILLGYVRGHADSSLVFDVPNPEVILSDGFLATHCLGVEGSPRGQSGWIGLSFRPAGDLDSLTDIRGTIWFDHATATLRRLDYEYRNLPRIPFKTCRSSNRPPRQPYGQMRAGPNCSFTGFLGPITQREGIGGTIHFAILGDGRWFAHRWKLLTPGEEFIDRDLGYSGRQAENGRTVRCYDRPPGCLRRFWAVPRLKVSHGMVAALVEDGRSIFRDDTAWATLLRVTTLQAGRTPAHLTGTVRDAEGQPVALAVVSTGQPVRSAMTDAKGRFEIRTLPPGALTVRVQRAGHQALERQVTLVPNMELAVDLVLAPSPLPGGPAPP